MSKPVKKDPRGRKKKARDKKFSRSVHVKCKPDVYAELSKKAKLCTKGNISAFLRHAGRQYTPKKGEKIAPDA